MKRPQRRFTAAFLDAGEGIIDMLFLLLTFFIVQNVWQQTLAEIQTQFIHDQKLDFVKAPITGPIEPPPPDRILRIVIGENTVKIAKSGIVNEQVYAFQQRSETTVPDIENEIYRSTKEALNHVLQKSSVKPEDIWVRLYFEKDAKVAYTVGVYEALMESDLRRIQWGLEKSVK